MILNAASDSKDVWSELFYYFCTPYNNWKLKTTFLWLCGCKIIHFASHLQQLQLFSSYLLQWWSNETGFRFLTWYLFYSWYKARKSFFCVIAIVQLALKILFYHVLKSFFCFLCCFLRLKIINCIFQCVKTRLSNWQWCSLAYLTCYQDTFEEENENVVHNKKEKKSFFLENWREKWKEKKDEKDKQWRKTHTETVEKSELKKRCVSERSIGISRIFLQDNLIFFSTLTISSPFTIFKKKSWHTKIQANPTFSSLSPKPEVRGLTQLFTEKSTMCLYALQLLTETFKMYWEDKGGPI